MSTIHLALRGKGVLNNPEGQAPGHKKVSLLFFYNRRARTMKIIPLADRVVIKTVEVEETTKGGLILTGSAKGEAAGGTGRGRRPRRCRGRQGSQDDRQGGR